MSGIDEIEKHCEHKKISVVGYEKFEQQYNTETMRWFEETTRQTFYITGATCTICKKVLSAEEVYRLMKHFSIYSKPDFKLAYAGVEKSW